jgi:hypothetical protein
MDFVKKHYEKVLLSVVLAGLVGALVFLPVIISADKQKQIDMKNQIINPSTKPLPDLDLTPQTAATARVQTPCSYDFNTTNKLFNPLEWKKSADGTIFPIKPGHEIDASAAVITKIAPLYFTLTLDAVTTNELGARYTIGVERQAAPTRAMQQKTRRFVSVDDPKKDLFTLLKISGEPENPDQLSFKLADTGETALLSRDKPFQRVDGYAVDLRYDPERLAFAGRRVNATISFGGDSYTIVDIKPDAVVLLAQSNQKKTSLRYAP